MIIFGFDTNNIKRRLLTDSVGRLVVSVVGQLQSAATAPLASHFTVGVTEAALSGAFPRGCTLENVSTAGQTIGLGPSGVTMATAGIKLAPGATYSDDGLQDLSILHAVSDAAAADLRAFGVS